MSLSEEVFKSSQSWDSHTTAMLFGVVVGEFFSYLVFDIRLLKAIYKQRKLKPLPCAYLFARYSMVCGVTVVAMSTARLYSGKHVNIMAVHWTRVILLPFSLTATSAIMGFRAVVLHYDRHRCITVIIYLFLVAELIGGLVVLSLAMVQVDHHESNVTTTLPGLWTVVPLGIGMLIDTIVCMMVVLPICCRPELPKAGEVRHLLLSDALFFGVISFLAKTLAIGFSIAEKWHMMDRFIILRLQIVVCTIFACRIFRGQEVFLRQHQVQAANPSLNAHIHTSLSALTARMEAPTGLNDHELPITSMCHRRRSSLTEPV